MLSRSNFLWVFAIVFFIFSSSFLLAGNYDYNQDCYTAGYGQICNTSNASIDYNSSNGDDTINLLDIDSSYEDVALYSNKVDSWVVTTDYDLQGGNNTLVVNDGTFTIAEGATLRFGSSDNNTNVLEISLDGDYDDTGNGTPSGNITLDSGYIEMKGDTNKIILDTSDNRGNVSITGNGYITMTGKNDLLDLGYSDYITFNGYIDMEGTLSNEIDLGSGAYITSDVFMQGATNVVDMGSNSYINNLEVDGNSSIAVTMDGGNTLGLTLNTTNTSAENDIDLGLGGNTLNLEMVGHGTVNIYSNISTSVTNYVEIDENSWGEINVNLTNITSIGAEDFAYGTDNLSLDYSAVTGGITFYQDNGSITLTNGSTIDSLVLDGVGDVTITVEGAGSAVNAISGTNSYLSYSMSAITSGSVEVSGSTVTASDNYIDTMNYSGGGSSVVLNNAGVTNINYSDNDGSITLNGNSTVDNINLTNVSNKTITVAAGSSVGEVTGKEGTATIYTIDDMTAGSMELIIDASKGNALKATVTDATISTMDFNGASNATVNVNGSTITTMDFNNLTAGITITDSTVTTITGFSNGTATIDDSTVNIDYSVAGANVSGMNIKGDSTVNIEGSGTTKLAENIVISETSSDEVNVNLTNVTSNYAEGFASGTDNLSLDNAEVRVNGVTFNNDEGNLTLANNSVVDKVILANTASLNIDVDDSSSIGLITGGTGGANVNIEEVASGSLDISQVSGGLNAELTGATASEVGFTNGSDNITLDSSVVEAMSLTTNTTEVAINNGTTVSSLNLSNVTSSDITVEGSVVSEITGSSNGSSLDMSNVTAGNVKVNKTNGLEVDLTGVEADSVDLENKTSNLKLDSSSITDVSLEKNTVNVDILNGTEVSTMELTTVGGAIDVGGTGTSVDSLTGSISTETINVTGSATVGLVDVTGTGLTLNVTGDSSVGDVSSRVSGSGSITLNGSSAGDIDSEAGTGSVSVDNSEVGDVTLAGNIADVTIGSNDTIGVISSSENTLNLNITGNNSVIEGISSSAGTNKITISNVNSLEITGGINTGEATNTSIYITSDVSQVNITASEINTAGGNDSIYFNYNGYDGALFNEVNISGELHGIENIDLGLTKVNVGSFDAENNTVLTEDLVFDDTDQIIDNGYLHVSGEADFEGNGMTLVLKGLDNKELGAGADGDDGIPQTIVVMEADDGISGLDQNDITLQSGIIEATFSETDTEIDAVVKGCNTVEGFVSGDSGSCNFPDDNGGNDFVNEDPNVTNIAAAMDNIIYADSSLDVHNEDFQSIIDDVIMITDNEQMAEYLRQLEPVNNEVMLKMAINDNDKFIESINSPSVYAKVGAIRVYSFFNYDMYNLDTKSYISGVKENSYNIGVGIEKYMLLNKLVVGAAGGYGMGNMEDVDYNEVSGNSQIANGAVYARYKIGRFVEVSAIGSYTGDNYDIERTVKHEDGSNSKSKGSPDTMTFGGDGMVKVAVVKLPRKMLDVNLYGKVGYRVVQMDDYSESGDAGLNVKGFNEGVIESEGGIDAMTHFRLFNLAVLVPSVSLGVKYNKYDSMNTEADFVNAYNVEDSFINYGPGYNGVSVAPKVQLGIIAGRTLSANIYMTSEVSKDERDVNMGANVRFDFR